jgi:hypothetical protein
VTVGVSKIMPGSKVSGYGIPAAAALVGAGIATRYPLVGAGVAAGAAAPFVLPVAQRVLSPSTTTTTTTPSVSGVMGAANAWRALNPRGLSAVSMGHVRMGTVYAG